MKVLLLYQFLNHTATVSALVDHLKPRGIEIECLDLPNLNFISGKKGKSSWIRKYYKLWMKIGIMRRLLSITLAKKYILAQLKDYDVVDIHFYSLLYNKIIPEIKKAKKPLIIMIWGSDFYRASKDELEQKRLGFDYADVIHVESECVKSDFLKLFPEYEDKIYVVQFGLNQLEWLKKSMEEPVKPTLVDGEIYRNKLIVTIGYNGSEGQQHLRIIKALRTQPENVKQKLHVLIPFTYGGTDKYKKAVIDALNETEIMYTFLDKRLSDDQMVELRRISHVAINIQITDSFSASVQEHFMAGTVQIIGDWLPYEVFYKQGLYAVKTDMNHLSEMINEVVTNYPSYHEKCEDNKVKTYRFSSWEYVTRRWETMYKSVG